MCNDSHDFSHLEEFSRVQEESLDKISEMSNQPGKTGKIINLQVITHNYSFAFYCLQSTSSSLLGFSESMDAEKIEANSTSHQVKLQQELKESLSLAAGDFWA